MSKGVDEHKGSLRHLLGIDWNDGLHLGYSKKGNDDDDDDDDGREVNILIPVYGHTSPHQPHQSVLPASCYIDTHDSQLGQ